MKNDEIQAAFLEELIKVAPDLEPADIGPDDHLQDDLELDSMDFLNLVAALHQRLGISIPEADYTSIATTARAVAYLKKRLG